MRSSSDGRHGVGAERAGELVAARDPVAQVFEVDELGVELRA